MDRLTYIDKDDVKLGYVVDFENFDKAVDKLAAFENLLEKRGLNNVEELDGAITKLESIKDVKAKEVGEAISTVVTYLADVISQKLDTATILDLAKYCEESRKYLAISKLENVLFCVDHVCNSPDNEIPDMVDQLRKYIRSEIAELEGEQND